MKWSEKYSIKNLSAEQQSVLALKIILVVMLIVFAVQLLLLLSSLPNIHSHTAFIPVVEPLFVATVIMGFLDTRHPYLGKLLRLYFLATTVLTIVFFFRHIPVSIGGVLSPLFYLWSTSAIATLQKYPTVPK